MTIVHNTYARTYVRACVRAEQDTIEIDEETEALLSAMEMREIEGLSVRAVTANDNFQKRFYKRDNKGKDNKGRGRR